MRSSNGGLAYGTSGNPQTDIVQETYAAKVAENEKRLKAESDAAPLIDELHIAEMEASGVKFTREDVIFTARDSTGQVVWLEKGGKTAGYAHLEARGHLGQIAKKFGVSESEVPRLLRNVIRDGRIVSNKIRKANGRDGYERIYEYNGGRILLAGIGLNGFMVSAYPLKKGKEK